MSGVHRPERRKLGVRTEDLRGNWESSIQAKIVVEPARVLYDGREAPAPRANADGSVEWSEPWSPGDTWWVVEQERNRVVWLHADGKGPVVTWTRTATAGKGRSLPGSRSATAGREALEARDGVRSA